MVAGICLSNIHKNRKNNVYVLMSDGELMEGSVWEFILFIAAKSINNIIIVIDNNNLQSATSNLDTHPNLKPIENKFKSFGWIVIFVMVIVKK